MTITGGCLCGAVRYAIEAEPIAVRTCWCRDCQFIGAGSGTVNVAFPSEAVKIEGVLADHVSRADSGNLMHRSFCARCGTPASAPRRPRPRQAANHHLDLKRPELGVLRREPPARTPPAFATGA